MPSKINVMKVIELEYDIYFDDYKNYVAFSYPGMYAGLGPNMANALLMAELRYASAKRKFFDARKDATERDWHTHAGERELKFIEVYNKKGVNDESCWSLLNVDKITQKGNT